MAELENHVGLVERSWTDVVTGIASDDADRHLILGQIAGDPGGIYLFSRLHQARRLLLAKFFHAEADSLHHHAVGRMNRSIFILGGNNVLVGIGNAENSALLNDQDGALVHYRSSARVGTHLHQHILRLELVFQRNLRQQRAGRDPGNNQSDKQDGHFDFLPHCNLPPLKLRSRSRFVRERLLWFFSLAEEAGSVALCATLPAPIIQRCLATFSPAAELPPPPGRLPSSDPADRWLRSCLATVVGPHRPAFWYRGRPVFHLCPAFQPASSARHPSVSAVDCASPAGR